MKRNRTERKNRLSARRRAEEHKSGFDSTSLVLPEGFKLWKIDKAGVKRIDILPFRVGVGNPYADQGELHFERTYWVHRGIGPNNGTYVCPLKTAGKKCPVCEYVAKLKQDKDPSKEVDDMIKALLPKERQLWALVDLAEADKGIQIWDVSYHLFGKQLDDAIKASDEDEGYEYFADPEDGMTVKVGIDEESFNGMSFYKTVSVGFKPRVDKYSQDFLDSVPCLDDVVLVPDYDSLEKVFLQVDDDVPVKSTKKSRPVSDDEDEDEGEDIIDDDEDEEYDCVACKDTGKNSKGGDCRACKPKPAKSEKPAAKKATKVSKVEEDDELPWDDEEEEVELPKKKGTKKAEPKVEEEDDEEEEVELPKKKGKSSVKKVSPKEEEDDEDGDDDWGDWS